jgi:hypothetical protein
MIESVRQFQFGAKIGANTQKIADAARRTGMGPPADAPNQCGISVVRQQCGSDVFDLIASPDSSAVKQYPAIVDLYRVEPH